MSTICIAITEEPVALPGGGSTLSYGIMISYYPAGSFHPVEIPHVSCNRSTAVCLSRLLKQYAPDPVHIPYVIEDFLFDMV